jgi:hypothetical protein
LRNWARSPETWDSSKSDRDPSFAAPTMRGKSIEV